MRQLGSRFRWYRSGVVAPTSRRQILAVAPNPALDRVALAAGAAAGGTVRASEYLDTPGGKATHVALVAAALGARTTLLAPLGGRRGERVRSLLAYEPLETLAVPIAGETRGTYCVVDPDAGDVLEVLEPPPTLTEQEVRQLKEDVESSCSRVELVVGAGSLPGGLEPDFYARLVHAAHRVGAAAIVDASGDALAATLEEKPDLVTPNLREAGDILGEYIPSDAPFADLLEAARALAKRGPRNVWLTVGATGSLFLRDDGAAWHLSSSAPRAVNAVGCGDALVGGFSAAFVEGKSVIDSASLGVASATDKLARLHPGRIDPPSVYRIARGVRRWRAA